MKLSNMKFSNSLHVKFVAEPNIAIFKILNYQNVVKTIIFERINNFGYYLFRKFIFVKAFLINVSLFFCDLVQLLETTINIISVAFIKFVYQVINILG